MNPILGVYFYIFEFMTLCGGCKSGNKRKRCGLDYNSWDQFEGFDGIQGFVAKKDKNSCNQLAMDSKNKEICVSHQ